MKLRENFPKFGVLKYNSLILILSKFYAKVYNKSHVFKQHNTCTCIKEYDIKKQLATRFTFSTRISNSNPQISHFEQN